MSEGALYRNDRQLCMVEVVTMRETEAAGLRPLNDLIYDHRPNLRSGAVLLRGPELLAHFDRGEILEFVTSGLRHSLTVEGVDVDPDGSAKRLLRGRWTLLPE